MHKTILIVEDNELNRALLCEILREQYNVLEAENGQEALKVLEHRADEVALVLLDVMMPVMDGYTFLDRVKAMPDLAAIPVIVMTQSDSEADEVAALSHGATDFVPKPYRPRVILHRIASIITLRETAALANEYKYDRLTGLYSKAFFYKLAEQTLAEHPGVRYDVVCSNIRNFVLFNDAFGIRRGDQALREVAQLCMERLGGSTIGGRLSGDRFMFLCEHETVGPRVLQDIAETVSQNSGLENGLVMKWGIFEVMDHTVSVAQMADRALLAAGSIREQYGTHCAVYDDHLRTRVLREQTITGAMETALREEQFCVYLQPKYDLHGDCLAGAEALVRWIHPELGFLPPGEFIPIFERNGFITRLDRYVWEQVCRLIQSWKQRGYPVLPVSVNVSRADAFQAELAAELSELVERYGVAPEEMHLEITESAYTKDPGQIVEAVNRLRERGFIVEMDDFGSGYSSLNMLNEMKLDVLKLDMKFIQSEMAKPVNRGILQLVVDLAKRMGLSVVAEGVETREQLNRLREIGCDYIQGYFYSRPLPIAEYEQSFLLQVSASQTPGRSREEQPRLPRLLVVEPSGEERSRTAEALHGYYEVLCAADEQEAMPLIAAHGREMTAAIISAQLPERVFGQLVQQIRRSLRTWRMPVLAAGPADAALEARVLAQGADDYIARPHALLSLRRRIEYMQDMDSHHRRERELQDEANLDFLTGLRNRRGLRVALDRLRETDLPLAVYMFDLDGLKRVNDRLGHMAGDEMIQSFSAILQGCTREADILARYGGDEFVAILRRMPDGEVALRKGREICEAIRAKTLPDGSHASCSVGIALGEPEGAVDESLFRRADQALYHAKKDDKGGACLWTEDMEVTP